MAPYSLIPSPEAAELAEDIRQLFEDLAQALPREQRAHSGECHPAVDVLEHDEAVEVTVDVAGVAAEALRVVFRGGVLLVVGEKAASAAAGNRTFHLLEREFGRFARAIRLSGSFDLGRAAATLREGQLTIVLPKIGERRGRAHRIPVTPPSRAEP